MCVRRETDRQIEREREKGRKTERNIEREVHYCDQKYRYLNSIFFYLNLKSI